MIGRQAVSPASLLTGVLEWVVGDWLRLPAMALKQKQTFPLAVPEPLAGPDGLERLVRSGGSETFFRIANQFRIQTDRFSCGPTSACIVLNVLRYGTEEAPESGPGIRAYTPENVLNESTEKIKPRRKIWGGEDPGLALEQLSRILSETHGLEVEKWTAQKEHRALLQEYLIEALKDPTHFVIVNFARGESGHFSPAVAYDTLSRSVLVLDTNPSSSPWGWIALEDLFDAMETRDAVENRGFLVISKAITR